MTARAYTTIAAVKAVLGITDTSQDTPLQSVVEAASALIEAEAGAIFTPYTDSKVFDAPAPSANPWEYLAPDRGVVGSILTVPDLLSITSLTAYGQALTEGNDFTILSASRPDALPGITRLLRVNGGRAVAWATNAQLPWQPRGAIHISGSWGYTATPPAIALLAEVLAVRLWHRRVRQYANPGAAPDGTAEPYTETLWTPTTLAMLKPFRQQATVLFA